MDDWIWIAIAAVAAVVVLALLLAAVAGARGRRRAHLREQFGPEYDRTVGQASRRSKAEQELAERERRREELDIRPLTPAARKRFVVEWEAAQRRFVDDPQSAVLDADRIVRAVLEQRGYPVDETDTERIAADVSVDHPAAVQRYRHGHDMLGDRDRAQAEGTENMRKAMIDFRAVFEEVVDADRPVPVP